MKKLKYFIIGIFSLLYAALIFLYAFGPYLFYRGFKDKVWILFVWGFIVLAINLVAWFLTVTQLLTWIG